MRNLYKPNRYNVASIQAQQTLGGDVMQADENGQYVEWRDYKWLLASHDFVRDQWKDLETENSVLKSEAESWKLRSDNWQKFCQSTRPDLFNENAHLKAEVENSNRINTELLLLSNQQASEVRRLKAEVERLRKAGDAMYEELGNFGMTWTFREAWNAAKEGKPSV